MEDYGELGNETEGKRCSILPSRVYSVQGTKIEKQIFRI